VRPAFTMLPKHLKGLGYETHAIGKWHLGMHTPAVVPTGRGFDTFYGFYGGAEDYFSHKNGLFRDYHDDVGANLKPDLKDDGTYSTLLYTKRAVSVIKSFAATMQQDSQSAPKSLFMYLAFQAIHEPDEAPQKYIDPFTATISNKGRRKVAGMISALDEGIGIVAGTLKTEGLWNDTLIIFTTDNGGAAQGFNFNWASNWPLRGEKRTLWEGGLRGVGLVAGAGLQKKGYVNHELFHAVDWMPSLLSLAVNGLDADPTAPGWKPWSTILANGEPPFQLGDGVDAWHSLSTGSPSPRTEIIHESHPTGNDDGHGQAVRVGDFKLILKKSPGWTAGDSWYESGSDPSKYTNVIDCGGPPPKASAPDYCDSFPCLFNIRQDPCEYHDLSKSMPDKVAQLKQTLQKYQRTSVPDSFHVLPGCSTKPNLVAIKNNNTWMPWCSATNEEPMVI